LTTTHDCLAIKGWLHPFTSTKCINNVYLFNVILRLAAFIQNAVTFFKLISFTNATICNSHILKSKRMIYECGYLNSCILKSFFSLILKRATYAFILSFFLVFLSSFASFIVFSYHSKFVSIRSLSSSPMVYKIFLFHLFVCFLVLTKVTTASLPVVWVFAMPYLLRCCYCHRYYCLRV